MADGPGSMNRREAPQDMTQTLSVVVPAYNEERYVGRLLERVAAVDLSALGLVREVIVVDDGSDDGTAGIAGKMAGVRLIKTAHAGKGRAVRAGIAAATGDYVIIHDADLEYDPADHVPMLQALLAGRADAVYGSRYLASGRYPSQSLAAYAGGRSLSVVGRVFTGRHLTDPATALKLFRRADISAIPLETSGFELDHEITARLLARGLRIIEVPVRYYPRTRAEGKKIRARDWFVAVGTFWKYRKG